jgi:hypothetical protein
VEVECHRRDNRHSVSIASWSIPLLAGDKPVISP